MPVYHNSFCKQACSGLQLPPGNHGKLLLPIEKSLNQCHHAPMQRPAAKKKMQEATYPGRLIPTPRLSQWMTAIC